MDETRPLDPSLRWLGDDLRRRWLSGDCVPIERYLAEHPELAQARELLQDLIYAEYCLAEQLAKAPRQDDYLRRFPQFSDELRALFEVHRAVLEARGGGLDRVLMRNGDSAKADVPPPAARDADTTIPYWQEQPQGGVPPGELASDSPPSSASLAARLKAVRFAPSRAAQIVADLAEALQPLHARGAAYGGIRPAVVLLDDRGRARLSDLALQQPAAAAEPASLPPGILAYRSPEQLQSGGVVSPSSDVYSLGVVLYELLTGKRPYRSTRSPDLAWEITSIEVRPPSQLDGSVPEALDQICQRCLKKPAAERYADAAALRRELHRYLQGRPAPLVPRLAALLLGVVLVVAVALAGMLALKSPSLRGRGRPPSPAAAAAAPVIDLDLLVSDPRDVSRRGLLRASPEIAPLRSGDLVRVQVHAQRPAYLYVVWIDSQGSVQPMYPWRPGDWDALPASQTPVTQLELPLDAAQAWPVAGEPGVETVLLLAREQPLIDAHELRLRFVDVPPQSAVEAPSVALFADGVLADEAYEPSESDDARTLVLAEPTTPANSMRQAQALLHERVKDLCTATRALVVIHR